MATLEVRLIRAEAQLDFIVDKMQGVLMALGGSLVDVVRTRVYVQSEDLIAAVALCHGRRFAEVGGSSVVWWWWCFWSFCLCFVKRGSDCFCSYLFLCFSGSGRFYLPIQQWWRVLLENLWWKWNVMLCCPTVVVHRLS